MTNRPITCCSGEKTKNHRLLCSSKRTTHVRRHARCPSCENSNKVLKSAGLVRGDVTEGGVSMVFFAIDSISNVGTVGGTVVVGVDEHVDFNDRNNLTASTTSTTTATMSVMLTLLLPLILIATSSLLLDIVLCYETILNRCKCQVWLWLALTLTIVSTNNMNNDGSHGVSVDSGSTTIVYNESLIWIHLIIFGNLIAIAFEGLRRRHVLSRLSTHDSFKQTRDFLKSIPIASWIVMMVDATTSIIMAHRKYPRSSLYSSSATTTRYSVPIFALALASLWLIRWHRHRQEIVREQGSTIQYPNGDVSSSFSSCRSGIDEVLSSSRPDESTWFTWNRQQTLQWIMWMLRFDNISDNVTFYGSDSQQREEDRREEQIMVVSILVPQCITGEVLDGLTVDNLMSMKIPFGTASRLVSTIAHRLVENYPKPSYMMPTVIHTTTNESNRSNQSSSLNKVTMYNNRSALLPQLQNKHNKDEVPSLLSQYDQEYNNTEEDGSDGSSSKFYARTNISGSTPFESRQRYNYNNHDTRTGDAWRTNSTFIDPTSSATMPFDPDHQQMMETIMRERFGSELPKLKVPISSPDNDTNSVHGQNTTTTSRQREAKDIFPSNHNNDHSHPPSKPNDNEQHQYYHDRKPYPVNSYTINDEMTPLPRAILDQMPPHLQEIVHRRPDLVRQLLQQKKMPQRRRQEHSASHENTPSNACSDAGISERQPGERLPSKFSSKMGSEISLSTRRIGSRSKTHRDGSIMTNFDSGSKGNFQGDIDDCGNDEDTYADDDECTSLIQRNIASNFPPEYKTIKINDTNKQHDRVH